MNFADLYKKIAQIDEQVTAVNPEATEDDQPANECGGSMPSADQPLMGEEGMEECGMTSISSQPPKQSDSVTMNVSMNGSGAGGIRDLMAILKNIEDGSKSDADKLFGDEKEVNFGEEFANEPNTVTLDIDAVTPAGDDLHSHAGNEVEKVNGGGNPYATVSETLVNRLSNMYNEIKEGYNPNSASAEHRRMLDKHKHDTLKAAAEKDDATDADKKRYQAYKDKKEAMRAEFDARMER